MRTLRSHFWAEAQEPGLRRRTEVQPNTTNASAAAPAPLQLVAPDPFESEEQFQAVKDHLQNLAATDPERYEMIFRIGGFRSAEYWMTQNFPEAQVVNAGCFPGDISLLGKDVRSKDTQFFVAMDPQNPRKFIAVNLAIFNRAFQMSGSGGEAADSPEMRAAEKGMLEMLKAWHKDGMSDGFLVLVSMGMDMAIYRFSGKDGLVDFPEGTEVVTKRVAPY